MKRILVILSFLVASNFSLSMAQETVMDEINYNQLEEYIRLAKEYYPQRKIVEEEEKQAKAEVVMQDLSYLDLFHASYYYRPRERTAIDILNPYVTNGFQLGVSLNLGRYLQKPFEGKNARSDLKIANLEKEIFDRELEKEVKSRYYTYILSLKELKLKTVAAQEVLSSVQSVTNRFEKGEITLDEYTSARAAASNSNSSRMQSEIAYLNAKDALEEIIGAPLKDRN